MNSGIIRRPLTTTRGAQHDADQCDAALGLAELAQENERGRAHHRREDGSQMAKLDVAEARADDDPDTDQPNGHRAPAPGPHLFAEKEDRQDGDKHRSQKNQRIGFGKGQMGERVKRKHARAAMPDAARPITSHGWFILNIADNGSCRSVKASTGMNENSVMKKPIWKTLVPGPML